MKVILQKFHNEQSCEFLVKRYNEQSHYIGKVIKSNLEKDRKMEIVRTALIIQDKINAQLQKHDMYVER